MQITVQADGVLRYQNEGGGGGARVGLRFTNAKSRIGKSFIDVSKFPVSYIQLSVPQDAREGVGLNMQVALYEWASVQHRAQQRSAERHHHHQQPAHAGEARHYRNRRRNEG